jgi:hypothetical protein
MEISGLTQFQQDLADTLWDCENEDEVKTVIDFYGDPAYTVYQLMVAAHYDDAIQSYDHVELAQQVIDNLLK